MLNRSRGSVNTIKIFTSSVGSEWSGGPMCTNKCLLWKDSCSLWWSTKAECSSSRSLAVAMLRPSQAGLAGGCEIIPGGGLLSGRLKAPWWAKGLILKYRREEPGARGVRTYSSGGV